MKKLLIVITLVLSLVVAPQLTKAATAQELQDMITALMAKVEQLKIQLGQQQDKTVQSAPKNNIINNDGCFNFNKNLKIGSRGQDVKNLQSVLREKEHLFGSSKTSEEKSGYYGKATASAVRDFQGLQNLPVSKDGQGVFGNMTRKEMNRIFGCDNANISANSNFNTSTSVNNSTSESNAIPDGILSGACISVDQSKNNVIQISETKVNIGGKTYVIPKASMSGNDIQYNNPDVYIVKSLPGEGALPKFQFSGGTAGAYYQKYGFMIGSLTSQGGYVFAIRHNNYHRTATAGSCDNYESTAGQITGSLTITADTSFTPSVTRRTVQRIDNSSIARFMFTAGDDDIIVSKLGFAATLPKGSIENFSLYDAGTDQIISGPFSGGTGDNTQTAFSSDYNKSGILLIPKHTSRTIGVIANFSPYAFSKDFKFGITSAEIKNGSSTNIIGLPAYSGLVSLTGNPIGVMPSITLLSPNNGETIVKGSTVNFTWQGGFGDGKDTIQLISLDQYPTQSIGGNYSYLPIKKSTDVPSSMNGFSAKVDPYSTGKYIVRIFREDPETFGALYYDDSDSPITIVNATTTVMMPTSATSSTASTVFP